jgi:hypothetical protein
VFLNIECKSEVKDKQIFAMDEGLEGAKRSLEDAEPSGDAGRCSFFQFTVKIQMTPLKCIS